MVYSTGTVRRCFMTHLACWILLHTGGHCLVEGFKLWNAWCNVRASFKHHVHCCLSQLAPGCDHYRLQTVIRAGVLNLTLKNNSKTTIITHTGEKSTSPSVPKLTASNPDRIQLESIIYSVTVSGRGELLPWGTRIWSSKSAMQRTFERATWIYVLYAIYFERLDDVWLSSNSVDRFVYCFLIPPHCADEFIPVRSDDIEPTRANKRQNGERSDKQDSSSYDDMESRSELIAAPKSFCPVHLIWSWSDTLTSRAFLTCAILLPSVEGDTIWVSWVTAKFTK